MSSQIATSPNFDVPTIARILQVSRRAVNKWIDSRRLRVSVPGIGDERQVSVNDLKDFAIGYLGLTEIEISSRVYLNRSLDDSLLEDPVVRSCLDRGRSLEETIRELISEKNQLLEKLRDLTSESSVPDIGDASVRAP